MSYSSKLVLILSSTPRISNFHTCTQLLSYPKNILSLIHLYILIYWTCCFGHCATFWHGHNCLTENSFNLMGILWSHNTLESLPYFNHPALVLWYEPFMMNDLIYAFKWSQYIMSYFFKKHLIEHLLCIIVPDIFLASADYSHHEPPLDCVFDTHNCHQHCPPFSPPVAHFPLLNSLNTYIANATL